MALGDRRAQSAPTSSCARKAMISRITPVLAGAVALVTIAQEKPQAQTQKLDKILFVSDRGSSGRSHLFTLNLDGSHPSRIIQSGEAELDGVFSPGGKQIACTVSNLDNHSDDIYVLDTGGSTLHRLTTSPPGTHAFAPAWSPDGKQIAYCTVEERQDTAWVPTLAVMDSDGKNRRTLVPGMLPSWSADGRTILYTLYPKDGPGPPALFVVAADGSHSRQLVANAAMGVFSPDGKHIAYVAFTGPREEAIATCEADGTHTKLLTHNKDTMVFAPVWTADGKQIVYSSLSMNSPGMPLIRINADGTHTLQLTHDRAMNFIGSGAAFFLVVGTQPAPRP